jgi:type IV pilus assembly protein PilE
MQHTCPPAPPAPRSPRRARGFTLIETMIVVGIAGIVSSIAYPSLEGHVLRARRGDALVTLMQAQLAQERFRANNMSYGSLAEIGLSNTSPGGYYSLAVTSNASNGYEVLASATARQARDANCRYLRLTIAGGGLTYASGTDATTSNPADINRKCWNQ